LSGSKQTSGRDDPEGQIQDGHFQGARGEATGLTQPRRGIRWHDKECEDEREVYIEFDWSNSDLIHQLNDWRQRFIRRQSVTTVKPPSVPYHQLEEDFLWTKHAEHLEEEVGNG
jgi:hypothetical protein